MDPTTTAVRLRLRPIDDGARNVRRVQQFIRIDLPLNVAAAIVVGLIYLVYAIEVLRFIELMIAGNIVVLLIAKRLLKLSRLDHAVAFMCLSMEIICIITAYIVPQIFPMLILLALWPIALALPNVGTRVLFRLMVISTVVSFAISVLALRPDTFGIGLLTPPWILNGLNLVLVPVFTGLFFLMLLHYSNRLTETLDQLHEYNSALQASERSLERKVASRTTELELKNTELSASEQQLAAARDEAVEASHAKSAFLANMSHEIRTPMNAIIGMADVLWETPLSNEQREYLRISRDAGESLLALIGDVLDLSKIEAGRLELETVDFSVERIVSRAVDVISSRAREKGLRVVSSVDEGVPSVLVGDPVRLRQVLVNLLGNAMKFTDTGQIEIAVTSLSSNEADRLTLEFMVRDSGIGIPRDRLGDVFEEFTQADAATARAYGGTGLGLAISRQIVELMGGKIWAESDVGKGTTIRFLATLGTKPVGVEAVVTAEFEPLTASLSRRNLRILLADDTVDNRTLIGLYLRDLPYVVDSVGDGRSAVDLFKTTAYDLVLMDVQMPILDGYAATRAIREIESQSGRVPTPIVAFTAYAMPEEAEASALAGCSGHLVKPIRKQALLAAISRYTSGRPEALAANGRSTDNGENAGAELVVEVDPELADLIPAYLERRRADLAAMTTALDAGDYEAIRIVGHSMKGSGSAYGFDFISATGAAAEGAAIAHSGEELHSLLTGLAGYLDRVRVRESSQPLLNGEPSLHPASMGKY